MWEIRQGADYDVSTENMRINLHMRAELVMRKVRAQKIVDKRGERLVFQFVESDDARRVRAAMEDDERNTQLALDQLYSDAVTRYERAGEEVTIERTDGATQKFLSGRYLDPLDRGYRDEMLVPTVASMVRNRNRGSGIEHLARADRLDLALETLVIDETKAYHRLFTAKTLEIARKHLEALSAS